MPRVVEREQREPHKRRWDANTRRPKGRGRPFGGRGGRRWSRKRAGRLRYDPQCGGDPSGVIREPGVPFACRGIEDSSHRACAGVGSGLVPQRLRRPSVGGPPRGDEEAEKPNADNNLDALHRRWRGARATYIASTCSVSPIIPGSYPRREPSIRDVLRFRATKRRVGCPVVVRMLERPKPLRPTEVPDERLPRIRENYFELPPVLYEYYRKVDPVLGNYHRQNHLNRFTAPSNQH